MLGSKGLKAAPLAIAALLYCTHTNAQFVSSGETIAARYSGSTIFLLAQGADETGRLVKKTGSGFVISNDGYVITSAHLLQGDNGGLLSSLKIVGSLGASFDPAFPTGLIWPLELVKRTNDVDVALLKLPTIASQSYGTVSLCVDAEPPIGARIFALGFPLGRELSINSGTLASKDGPRGLWKTDILINSGSSGGPVFNDRAQVIGVTKGGIEGAPGNNYFVPLHLIPDVLSAGKIQTDSCHGTFDKVPTAAQPEGRRLPSSQDFDGLLKTCALGANITVSADIVGSIKEIYEGDRTKGKATLQSQTEYLKQFPESQRLDAYRLYTSCIAKILNKD